MGRLHLGRWARFIPYPVMGGFLAGTGWLIARSSFKVIAGLPLEWSELPHLMQGSSLIHWLPGVLFAGVLIGVTRSFPNPMVLPAMLLGAIVGFNLLWQAIGFTPLTAQGWFLESFSSTQVWHSWSADSFTQVDWQVLRDQSGTLMVLMVVIVIALLLNITGIELVSQQDSTLDSELCTNGIANLAAALYGGIEGQLSPQPNVTQSQLWRKQSDSWVDGSSILWSRAAVWLYADGLYSSVGSGRCSAHDWHQAHARMGLFCLVQISALGLCSDCDHSGEYCFLGLP